MISIAVSGTEFDDDDGVTELIATARAADCDAVEFWYPKNATRHGLADSLARLADAGIRIACVSTPSSLYGTGQQEAVALLEQAIALAARTGADRVNTYFGHAGLVDDDAAVRAYAHAVEPLLDLAAAAGVVLVLENEFDAFGWDPLASDITRRPRSLARLCERLDHPAFGLNFDAANFYSAGVDPVADAWPRLAGRVRYAHVKDIMAVDPAQPVRTGWTRYTDHSGTYDTTSLGAGALNWHTLVRQLVAAGYQGYLTLEPHCGRAGLSAEVAHAAAYLRRIIAAEPVPGG